MYTNSARPTRFLPVALLVLASCGSLFAADGFKVESELLVEKSGTKVRMLTLFSDGIVYDFIENEGKGEMTIFEPKSDSFLLLDPVYRIRTRLPASEIREKIEAARPEMLASKKPLAVFAAKPVFELSVDEASGTLKFQCPWVDYEIKTRATEDEGIATAYFDFCDWYSYLNVRLHPGALRPLLRMEVNRILREKKRLPERVLATTWPNGKGFLAKSEKLETTHVFSRRLTEPDLNRITETLALTRHFREVPFEEYQIQVAPKTGTTQDKE